MGAVGQLLVEIYPYPLGTLIITGALWVLTNHTSRPVRRHFVILP